MSWTDNPIMEWSKDSGTTWNKISDHGRSPLNINFERIENKQRMANGTMRRYSVSKKRVWSTSWDNLPDKDVSFLANGKAGNWMETFHNETDGMFLMRLRSGDDVNKNITGTNGDVYKVMISDFSKEIIKRGPAFDLWSLDITIEEV